VTDDSATTEPAPGAPATAEHAIGSSAPTSLYGWLWSKLPGGRALRVVLVLLIVAAVVVVLFGWVFPWLEPRLPWVDVTVGGAGAGG